MCVRERKSKNYKYTERMNERDRERGRHIHA